MSIRDSQIEKAKEAIVHNELKKGSIPTNKLIQERVSDFFSGKIPGMPYFKPYTPERYSISNNVIYNNSFSNLEEDLVISFNEIGKLTKEIKSIFEYYENEKIYVESKIEKLYLSLEAAELPESKSGIYVENFSNFFNIDFYGDAQRNIPKTDAYIDLNDRSAYLQRAINSDRKVDISESSCSFSTNLNVVRTNNDINVICKDYANDVFVAYLTSMIDGKGKATIEIVNKEAMLIDSIIIKFKSLVGVTLSCEISEDETNFVPLYSNNSKSVGSWVFNPQKVKKIRLSMEKEGPEGYEDDEFYYYFIIEDISFYYDRYMSKSVIVTKPIDAGKIIDKITLIPDDLIYNNTDISYYFSLEREGVSEWSLIESGKPFDPKILSSKREVLIPSFSNQIGDYYKLVTLPANTELNSIRITPGYQMWKLERLYTSELQEEFTVVDIHKASIEESSYMMCEEYDVVSAPGRINCMTQYIDCDKQYDIPKRKITGASQVMLFVNNVMVPSNNGEYNIKLLKGLNKVQIYFKSNSNISHNINFKSYSFNLYAERPSGVKSIHDLEGSNRADLFSVFENEIVLNYNPKDIQYLIEYKYLSDSLEYKNSLFRIMTVLTTEDENITPKVMNQTIIIE